MSLSKMTAEKAANYFDDGYCCAEAVFLAIAESLNIQSDLVPKLATGFCAGIGRTGSICGAVSGGILAINLKTGRNEPGISRDENCRLIKHLLKTFSEEFGFNDCEQLIGCNIGEPECQERFKAENMHDQCRDYVHGATRIVMESFEG